MILQPKRWQSADEPMYDPIRHRPWFRRLEKRKVVLPRMAEVASQWAMEGCVLTQEELCDQWNVSPREFRDYYAFVSGVSRPFASDHEKRTYEHILDAAYRVYCEHSAIRPIQKFIEDMAPLYGILPRPVWERWETDPAFYPLNYSHAKASERIPQN